ncbi:MAG: hypothetical protein ACKKL4_01375 [Patescibacteria group bacterium]
MREALRTLGDTLAHAYLLIGPQEQLKVELDDYLREERGLVTSNNINIYQRSYERLGIDDVRAIINFASKTSIGSRENKIIIISINGATREAQNAMLKLLEEPSEDTIFFIIAHDKNIFLSTVRSRLQIIEDAGGVDKDIQELVNKFLSAQYSKRMEMCVFLFGDSKKGISPDRAKTTHFLQSLARHLLLGKEQISDKWLDMYREVEHLAQYAGDTSSSCKYLIEYVATRIPQVGK